MAEASSVGTTSEASLEDDQNAKNEGEAVEAVAPAAVATDVEVPPERVSWGSKVGYILTLVGYAVGFGNIWRFPYLLHSNGGAAFLIPYLTMLALEGIPIFFLELAVGQRLRKGALGSWNEVSPYLGGVGISCGFVCYFVSLYYNTLLAWVLSYLFDSFRGTLPWTNCYTASLDFIKGDPTGFEPSSNKTVALECLKANQPTKYYYYRRVLDVSDSITEAGNFNGYIMLYLIISWIVVWAILIKGIKSSEKVVYFTALFPYVTLFIFFVHNFTLDGWQDGYKYLFQPDWSVLLDPAVWLKAGTQIFFSLGVAYGCLITFASYLPSNNDCYKDAIWVSLINCSTSLFATFVIFPILGFLGNKKFNECITLRKLTLVSDLSHLGHFDPTVIPPFDLEAHLSDKKFIEKYDKRFKIFENEGDLTKYQDNGVDKPLNPPFKLSKAIDCNVEREIRASGGGTGLVFIAFAEAALHLPAPQFWCFLFFLMLFTLGVDSGFGTCEGAISALEDIRFFNYPRWVLTSMVCGSLFCFSMAFTMGFGIYVQVFVDEFVANWGLLIVAFFETIGVAWVYGLAKFSYDILLMTGRKPNVFMLVCWKFVSPFLLFVILLMTIVQLLKDGNNYSKYNKAKGDTESKPYPGGFIALGYLLWLIVLMWVPLQATLVYFGKSLLKPEIAAYFPEEELRAERNIQEGDDFGDVDKLLMGKSVQDFNEEQERAKSKTSLGKGPVGDGAA